MKLLALLGLSGMLVCSSVIPAQQASKQEPPKPNFWYWDNWTDDHGVSHMTYCPVTSFDLKCSRYRQILSSRQNNR